MAMSVAEAAKQLGRSEQRVRQLLAAGELPGAKVGGHWVLEESAVQRSQRLPRRPMSSSMIWELLHADPERIAGLRPPERQRITARLRELLAAPDPASLLRSWSRNRGQTSQWQVAARDLKDLAADHRIIASGISDPRAGISSSKELEAYIEKSDLRPLAQDYLLVENPRSPNVVLHVIDGPLDRDQRLPILAVAADLADRDRPRENNEANRLVAGLRP